MCGYVRRLLIRANAAAKMMTMITIPITKINVCDPEAEELVVAVVPVPEELTPLEVVAESEDDIDAVVEDVPDAGARVARSYPTHLPNGAIISDEFGQFVHL